MSGWRIVPVSYLVPCQFPTIGPLFNAGWNAAMESVAKGAPEPDWEALAGIVLNDDVYDQYATGGEIRRLAAALRATFGSKP